MIFETDPNNGHAWAVLGEMDQADGEVDAALECFRRGTRDPGADTAPAVQHARSASCHDQALCTLKMLLASPPSPSP